jgi:ankyrin repeat protein
MMNNNNNSSEATRGLGLLLRDFSPYPPPLERLRDFFAAGADPNIIIHDRHNDEDGGDNFPHIMLDFVKYETYGEDGIANALAVFEQFVSNPMFDMDALNSSGEAVIHIACKLDNPYFLRVILRSGRVNVNLPSTASIFDGFTALHFACCFGKVEQARLLLEDGRVDIDARESRGRTPLFSFIVYNFGSDRDHYDIAAMLISRGSDLMVADIFGCNVLHYCRDPNICRLLLDNGADPLHVDDNGTTPIQDADIFGLHEVRDLMVKHVNFPRFRAIYQLLKKKDLPMNTLKAIHSQSHPPLYTSEDTP